MEMDIGANNYPFQCFLCFLKLKLHPSFLLNTINNKICTLSHNFSHDRKIYLIRILLSKFRFKTRFYTQTLVMWSWHSNVSHTESWPHFIIKFEEPQWATRSTKIVHSFFILIFNRYVPHQIFLIILIHF